MRGADTDRLDLASQSSGLWAISAGLSHNIKDDQQLLEKGMLIYDALFSWAMYLQSEKHTQNPTENLLLDVYKKFLRQKSSSKKIPAWAQELREIIQDQIDTNLTLSLKELSHTLHLSSHILHTIFWTNLTNRKSEPSGALQKQIDKDFGSYDKLKVLISKTSKGVDGNGWGILGYQPYTQKLTVLQCENHEKLTQWGTVFLRCCNSGVVSLQVSLVSPILVFISFDFSCAFAFHPYSGN